MLKERWTLISKGTFKSKFKSHFKVEILKGTLKSKFKRNFKIEIKKETLNRHLKRTLKPNFKFQIISGLPGQKKKKLFVHFLGESMARQSAFGFIWPLQCYLTPCNLFYIWNPKIP